MCGLPENLTVSFKDWHWQCGDECCDEYGTSMSINGVQVIQDIENNHDDIVRELLQSLGITKFEIEHIK